MIDCTGSRGDYSRRNQVAVSIFRKNKGMCTLRSSEDSRKDKLTVRSLVNLSVNASKGWWIDCGFSCVDQGERLRMSVYGTERLDKSYENSLVDGGYRKGEREREDEAEE